MRLIKTPTGRYINADQVKSFYADERGRVFAIFGLIVRSDGVVVDYEEQLLERFDSNAAAQTSLDKFVAKLNSEETNHVED